MTVLTEFLLLGPFEMRVEGVAAPLGGPQEQSLGRHAEVIPELLRQVALHRSPAAARGTRAGPAIGGSTAVRAGWACPP